VTRRAVFFDRDGTLCEERGYINHPERLRLLPQSAGVLRELRARGHAVVVVTNQAGVARGYFPQHVLEATHQRLKQLLAKESALLDGIYACHHHPELGAPGFRAQCRCRKPRPGMLEAAARDLDLELARSFIVGDSFKDIGAGHAAGLAGSVLLRTGYGRGELLWKDPPAGVWPDYVADDLEDALAWILSKMEDEP